MVYNGSARGRNRRVRDASARRPDAPPTGRLPTVPGPLLWFPNTSGARGLAPAPTLPKGPALLPPAPHLATPPRLA